MTDKTWAPSGWNRRGPEHRSRGTTHCFLYVSSGPSRPSSEKNHIRASSRRALGVPDWPGKESARDYIQNREVPRSLTS